MTTPPLRTPNSQSIAAVGPPEAQPLTLVAAADDAYAMPLGVMLFSALSNLVPGTPVEVYVLDGGIESDNRERVTRALRRPPVTLHLEFIETDVNRFEGLQTKHWIASRLPAGAFLRLLIPEVLPAHVQHLVYLDCDIIVEGDLEQLWTRRSCEHTVWAVQDHGIPFLASAYGVGPCRELGLQPDAPYFNSGVMLINLERWRSTQVSERAELYLRSYREERRFNDQEALNAVLAGEWYPLDPRWNQQGLFYAKAWKRPPAEHPAAEAREGPYDAAIAKQLPELLEDPFIIHFTGHTKPWGVGVRARARRRFFYYLWQSNWYQRWHFMQAWLTNELANMWRLLRIRSRPYRPALRPIQ